MALRLVHAPALLSSRVVDRDAALAALHEHHEADDGDADGRHGAEHQDVDVALSRRFEGLADGTWEPRHDAREDQERYAVADAALVDLFAEPHHEQGSGHQGDDSHEVEVPGRTERKTLCGQRAGQRRAPG